MLLSRVLQMQMSCRNGHELLRATVCSYILTVCVLHAAASSAKLLGRQAFSSIDQNDTFNGEAEALRMYLGPCHTALRWPEQ